MQNVNSIQRYLPKQLFDTMAEVVLKNRVGYYNPWLEKTSYLMNKINFKKIESNSCVKTVSIPTEKVC